MQIFSLFIVFSAWSSCNFQEQDLTRERDSCRKHTIFFGSARAGTTRNREREGTYCIILYFQVPRDERSARVVLYFWVPRKERHASFLSTSKSVKQAFWVPCKEQLAKRGYRIFWVPRNKVMRTLIAMTKKDCDDEEGSIATTKDRSRRRRSKPSGRWPSTTRSMR